MSYRRSVAGCLVVNLLALAVIAERTARPAGGAFIAAIGFWALLLWFPHGFNRGLLLSPGNYVLFLFFCSMVIGPPVMMFGELLPRLWILTMATWDTSRVYEYVAPAAMLWTLALFAYLVATKRSVDGRFANGGVASLDGERASDWMLVTGVVLIVAGIVGLTLATGSLQNAFSLGGRRETSQSILGGGGSYRFTAWMEGVPVGAVLVWYYVTRRIRVGRAGAAIVLLLLYVPLFPFYLYTAGRARALVPLLLLVAMYHRFVYPFSARWLVAGLVAITPVLSMWSLYRAGASDVSLQGDRVNTVVAADFSRFEVSTVALAGFTEAGLPFYLGETLLAATTHWLPGESASQSEGTAATAEALAGDRAWALPSSYATALVTESYLNFGILGVIVGFSMLGRFVRWLDRRAESTRVLTALLALSCALKVPFGVSLAISVSQIVWAVGFPLGVAFVMQALLRRRSPLVPAVRVTQRSSWALPRP